MQMWSLQEMEERNCTVIACSVRAGAPTCDVHLQRAASGLLQGLQQRGGDQAGSSREPKCRSLPAWQVVDGEVDHLHQRGCKICKIGLEVIGVNAMQRTCYLPASACRVWNGSGSAGRGLREV